MGVERQQKRSGRCAGLLWLAAALLAPIRMQAETLTEAWKWVQFTTYDGLPSNAARDVLETTTGRTWAATDAGLAWYDGHCWHSIGTSEGLAAKRPRYLADDSNGGVLVVVDGQLFQGTEKGFRAIPVEYQGAALEVLETVALSTEEFLLKVGDALFILQGGTLRPFAGLPGGLDETNTSLWSTQSGHVWLNTSRGLHRWEGKGWELQLACTDGIFLVSALRENRDGKGLAAIASPPSMQGLYEWENGQRPIRNENEPRVVNTLDVAPSGDGLVQHAGGNIRIGRGRQWSRVVPPTAYLQTSFFLRFRNNGDLWTGSLQGLFLHKSTSRRWSYWKQDPGDARARTHEILQARDGSIWVATGNGVEIHHPDGRTEWIHRILDKEILTVTGLGEDTEGHIWISSGDAFPGAYRWDGKEWRHFGSQEGLDAPAVHKIRKDRRGRLWFLGLSRGFIATRSVDREPGAFVLEKGRFVHWGIQEGLPDARVYAFAEGEDGAFWFGTNGGIGRWREGTWTYWSTEQRLRGTNIFTLATDRQNRLWFGDRGNGLGLIEEDQVRYLTTADGLASDVVWDLRMDEGDKLWITTQNGLCSYKDGVWATLGADSGLHNLHLWPVLPLADRVYVGTMQGIAILNLGELRTPGPIVRFSVPVVLEHSALLQWKPFTYWGELPSRSVETRYRLDTGPWSRWSTQRELSLDELPAGEHLFRVQAKTLLGGYEETGQSVSFRIAYPLYRRPVFFIPAGLLALAVIILGVAFAVGRKKLRDEALERSEQRYRELLENTRDIVVSGQRQAEEVQRHLEEQIRQNQKLESYELLTGGMAQDFHRLLTAVLGHAALARMEIPVGSPAEKNMQQIESAASRAADLAIQLQAHSGKAGFSPRPLELSALVEDMRHLLQTVTSKKVFLRCGLASGLPAVQGDPGQIRQAIMNLVRNASEAIGADNGVIDLRTSLLQADRAYLKDVSVGEDLREGEYVCLEVADTGCGMSAGTRGRIFEPLFSTKNARGLGLAAVLGIVQAHGGAIRIESSPGRGSTFRVLFPILGKDMAGQPSSSTAPEGHCTGTILVIEEDQSLRDLAINVLEQAGFHVFAAGEARQGLELFRNHSDDISAVVLDGNLSQVGGTGLFMAIRSIRSDERVLLCSRFTDQGLGEQLVGLQHVSFLQKPYAPARLLEKMREILAVHS